MTAVKLQMSTYEEDDKESETCHSLSVVEWQTPSVDCFPSPKERMKSMAEFSVKSFKFLNTMDWTGFDQYARSFVSRTKHGEDATALVAISFADRNIHMADMPQLERLFREIEHQIPLTSLPNSIRIRFICPRAYVLKIQGKGPEAKRLLAQAVQLAINEPTSNATAYCFAQYAIIALVHDNIETPGDFSVPSENVWKEAEHYTLLACRQHQEWVKDLDDDYKISEELQQRFCLWMFIRYVSILLRSCTGAGFTYFDDISVPKENLDNVRCYLDRLKASEQFLVPRNKLRLRLVECDYFLRQAQLAYRDSSTSANELTTIYQKAQSCLGQAKSVSYDYVETRMAQFDRSFLQVRLDYINAKLDSLKHGLESGTNQIDGSLVIRYADYIKEQENRNYGCQDEIGNSSRCPFGTSDLTLPKPVGHKQTSLDEDHQCPHLVDLRLDDEAQTPPKYAS